MSFYWKNSIYLSENFPIEHGFTGKAFASLATDLERERLSIREGLPVVLPRQKHSTDFLRIQCFETPQQVECDALLVDRRALSTDSNFALGVYTADCVPMLVAGKYHRAVIHAGWRGMAGGIIQNVMNAIRKDDPETPLRVMIGPCARMDAYQTGIEVVEALRPFAVYREDRPSHSYYTDLPGTALKILEQFGPLSVFDTEICTISDLNWHSYRRDGAPSGRNLSFLAIGPERGA